jgi:hypothetical protein
LPDRCKLAPDRCQIVALAATFRQFMWQFPFLAFIPRKKVDIAVVLD